MDVMWKRLLLIAMINTAAFFGLGKGLTRIDRFDLRLALSLCLIASDYLLLWTSNYLSVIPSVATRLVAENTCLGPSIGLGLLLSGNPARSVQTKDGSEPK